MELRAPFPWFGGKSRVAEMVWDYFGGEVCNYVEPFFGSGAVLLARPGEARIETVNDKDCYVANFWRAVQQDPEAVAYWADQPVNEADLHARHLWLVCQEGFRDRMLTNPDYYDAKIAGWWVWGISCWIGSGWCYRPDWNGRINGSVSPRGIHAGIAAITRKRRPQLSTQNGINAGHHQDTKAPSGEGADFNAEGAETQGVEEIGVHKKRPGLTNKGGVNGRSLIEPAGPASGRQTPQGGHVWKKRPSLRRGGRGVLGEGLGVIQQVPDISGDSGAAGRGVHASGLGAPQAAHVDYRMAGSTPSDKAAAILGWMERLAARLRNVRVCCGDWTRVLGRSPTECIGITAVFLDPPYGGGKVKRKGDIYNVDCLKISGAVRAWAIAHGDNPALRIALCGYEGEHEMPESWRKVAWKSGGGYGNNGAGNGRSNAELERIWFSPACLDAGAQPELFDTGKDRPAKHAKGHENAEGFFNAEGAEMQRRRGES